MDAAAKLLVATIPAAWVLLSRSLAVGVAALALMVMFGRHSLLVTRAPGLLAARSIVFGLTSSLIVVSVKYLSFAETTTLFFVSPILTVYLASLVLGEHVTRRAMIAALIGFAGVVCVVRPTPAGFSPYYLLPLGAALSGALQDVLTRKLHGKASAPTLVLYGMAGTIAIAVLGLPLAGQPLGGLPPIGAREAAIFGVTCAGAALGYTLGAKSFLLAPIRVIAPLRYVNVIWAVLLGILVWNDVPSGWTILGIALVITAGLICVWVPRRG